MAKTVREFIASTRYALRDVENTVYEDDDELLDHLNRANRQLDSILMGVSGDQVLTSDSVTLASAANSATAPTDCDIGLHLWRSTNYIEKVHPQTILEKRIDLSSTTGPPRYWAHQGTNIIVDYTADQEYTLTLWYNQKTTDLTLNGDMPYNDMYNDVLLEAVTILAKNPREFGVAAEGALHDYFYENVMKKVLKRIWRPKLKKLGF